MIGCADPDSIPRGSFSSACNPSKFGTKNARAPIRFPRFSLPTASARCPSPQFHDSTFPWRNCPASTLIGSRRVPRESAIGSPRTRSTHHLAIPAETSSVRSEVMRTAKSNSESFVKNNSRLDETPSKQPPKSTIASSPVSGRPCASDKNTSFCLMALVVS